MSIAGSSSICLSVPGLSLEDVAVVMDLRGRCHFEGPAYTIAPEKMATGTVRFFPVTALWLPRAAPRSTP